MDVVATARTGRVRPVPAATGRVRSWAKASADRLDRPAGGRGAPPAGTGRRARTRTPSPPAPEIVFQSEGRP